MAIEPPGGRQQISAGWSRKLIVLSGYVASRSEASKMNAETAASKSASAALSSARPAALPSVSMCANAASASGSDRPDTNSSRNRAASANAPQAVSLGEREAMFVRIRSSEPRGHDSAFEFGHRRGERAAGGQPLLAQPLLTCGYFRSNSGPLLEEIGAERPQQSPGDGDQACIYSAHRMSRPHPAFNTGHPDQDIPGHLPGTRMAINPEIN